MIIYPKTLLGIVLGNLFLQAFLLVLEPQYSAYEVNFVMTGILLIGACILISGNNKENDDEK